MLLPPASPRPPKVEIQLTKPMNQEHKKFLDDLRESGKTNMFGAAPYLEAEFDLERKEAKAVLMEWMDSFREAEAES